MRADYRWSVDPATPLALIDPWLDPGTRVDLEERLWRPIGTQATLEVMRDDPAFLADPGHHPAMFADHGIVHARDVALGVVRLAAVVDGVLLPKRPAGRQAFLTALGVATAYLHDVGMVDLTRSGRRVHAIVAAQLAFGPEVDGLVGRLLAAGPIRERLDEVAAAAPFAAPLDRVVRELLSLSVIHGKSLVPAALLDDRRELRRLLQRFAVADLDAIRVGGAFPRAGDPAPVPDAARDAYAWLDAAGGAQADLADDAIDAMRVLRAADVLRQRGTVLRTSGGFEVCMDAETARAVCTLRPASGDAAYVITYDDPRGAGEANIREAAVTDRGHLRIAFHRGVFATPDAVARAVASTAGVVVDIESDVIPSFSGFEAGTSLGPPTRPQREIRIQLERPGDRPAFADEVAARVAALHPELAPRLVSVADTQSADAAERARFLAAEPLDGDGAAADELLRRLAERGADVDGLDRAAAFSEVGRCTVRAGEVLAATGSAPSFVYVPMGNGLVVRPIGGYAPSPLPPWVPVGTTGVIRRAERNSEIVAVGDVDVVVIPGEVYARAWFRPLTAEALVARLRPRVRA
jgi:hypothetical protein